MFGAGGRRITSVLAIALVILNDYVNLCAGGYALSSVLSGGSSYKFALSDIGNLASVAYSHAENAAESVTLAEQGRATFSSGAGASWNFTNYSDVVSTNDYLNDVVGAVSGSANLSQTISLTGAGSPYSGISTNSTYNTFTYQGGPTVYAAVTVTQTVLPTVNLGGFLPGGPPTNWLPVSARLGSVSPGIAAAVQQIGVVPAGKPNLLTGFTTTWNVAPVPVLTAQLLPSYGGWLGPNAPGARIPSTTYNPLGFLNVSDASWQPPLQALKDGVSKVTLSQQLNPLRLSAGARNFGTSSSPLVQWVYDQLTAMGETIDFFAGLLNQFTSGWTARVLGRMGLSWLVDTQSQAYQMGQYASEAIDVVMTLLPLVAPPLAIVSTAYFATKAAFALVCAGDSLMQGDFKTALAMGWGALLTLAMAIPLCGTFGKVGKIVSIVARVGQVYNAVQSLETSITRFQNGDILGGLLSLAQAGADVLSASRNCFTGDTRLMARGAWGEGWRRIDAIAVGDEVLSRDENDPTGALAWKPVEMTFQTYAKILHLHVGGELIRTTAEHPFFAYNKGWIAAGALEHGDRLLGRDGEWVVVDEIFDTGEWEGVYNLLVVDFHTYFVGGEEWGFSVWAHNAYDVKFQRWKRGDAIDKPLANGSAPSWKTVQSRYWKNRYQAARGTGEFSKQNLDRMYRGLAPLDYNPRTGQMQSRELHHVIPQRAGTNNGPINIRELIPDWHAQVDPFRQVPGISPIRGIQ